MTKQPDRTAKGISLSEIIDAYNRNNGVIKATARELDCAHSNVLRRLRKAVLAGDDRIDPAKILNPTNNASPLTEEILKAREELGMRNDRKKAKGDWRKPSYISKPGGPCILGIFGDPHIDNSGTDLDLFEEEISRLDPANRVFGACVGDFFDNWPRALGHLYAESGDPAPAWVLFKHWMENNPFLFSVTGNHDLFVSGAADFLTEFCRSNGIILRRSGGRFLLDLGGGNPISVSMRHIWQGGSQYSEAHALKRAAVFGYTDDDVIAGGHTHKGEIRVHVRPHDGKVTRLVQVSAFKRLDNYPNDKGFMSPETPPVVWLAMDDREPVTSHSRVQAFYDFGAARAQMEYQRGKNQCEQ